MSQLSKKHSSKAVVISNGTSAHDVIKMVARKLHMDQKQTNRMCLVVELCAPEPQNGKNQSLRNQTHIYIFIHDSIYL